MITSALISLLSYVVYGMSFVLPSGQLLPYNFSSLISDILTYAYGWDWIIPMNTVTSVIGTLLLFIAAEIAWRGGKYIIALLRGN